MSARRSSYLLEQNLRRRHVNETKQGSQGRQLVLSAGRDVENMAEDGDCQPPTLPRHSAAHTFLATTKSSLRSRFPVNWLSITVLAESGDYYK